MKSKKKWRNAIILYVVVWIILYSTLRFVIEVPDTIDLFVRLSLGCLLIAMSYFYVANRNEI